MSFLEFVMDPGLRPFLVAFTVVLALMAVELILSLLGLSTNAGVEGDLDADFDIDGPDLDLSDVDLDSGFDVSPDILEALEAGNSPSTSISPADLDTSLRPRKLLVWLGIGLVPLTIWFVGLLTGFALSGYILQLASSKLTGALAPLGVAVLVAIIAGLGFARTAAKILGRVLPKTQSTAIRRRSYHRRKGVITVGTARSGNPAQVRFADGYGNLHYTLVEPLDPKDELPQGTEVLIVRLKGGAKRAVALSTLPKKIQ